MKVHCHQEIINEYFCHHCRDTRYVFIYWLERYLARFGLHMTDIPGEVFKKISLDCLQYCHCNIIVAFRQRNQMNQCASCGGSAWQFTEAGKQAGYCWHPIASLTPDEIASLPCEYFERCPCDEDEQSFKQPQKRESFQNVPGILTQFIPRLSFG